MKLSLGNGFGLLHGVGSFFALDIGTTALRLVQLSGDLEHGWTLEKFAYVPIDPKTLHDDSEIGRRRFGEIVLGAVQQAGITTKNVALGMPAGQTYTAIVEVDAQNEKDLAKTMRFQLDKYTPMAVDEAEVDYALLGASPNDATKMEVLVSSVSKQNAETLLEKVEGWGLNVIAQEPEPIAMARSLMPVGSQDAQLIIDLGDLATDLVITYRGAPRLVRSIPGGFSQFVHVCASTLNVEENQARQFIMKFGLAQDKVEGQVFRSLASTLETFAQELKKSINFFQGKYMNVPMGGIVLSGLAAVIPFIAEYIEAKTGVRTVQGNPWQLVRTTEAQQQALAPVAHEFAVAIGLAERSNE